VLDDDRRAPLHGFANDLRRTPLIRIPSPRTRTAAVAALLYGSGLVSLGAQNGPALPPARDGAPCARATTRLQVELRFTPALRFERSAQPPQGGALHLVGGTPGQAGVIAIGGAPRTRGGRLAAAQLFPGRFDAQGTLHLELPDFAGEVHALGFELRNAIAPARMVLGARGTPLEEPGTLAAALAQLLLNLAEGERARLHVSATLHLGARSESVEAHFELGQHGGTRTLLDADSGVSFHAADTRELAQVLEAVLVLQAFGDPAAQLTRTLAPRNENHAVPSDNPLEDGGDVIPVDPPISPVDHFESTPLPGDPKQAGGRFPPVPRKENNCVPFTGTLADGGDILIVPPPLIGGFEAEPLPSDPRRAGDKQPPVPRRKHGALAFDGTLGDGGEVQLPSEPPLVGSFDASPLPSDPRQADERFPLGPRLSTSNTRVPGRVEETSLGELREWLSRRAE